MIHRIDGEYPGFVLDTKHTTYAFHVLPSGHLEHLHYGRSIHVDSLESLEPLTEKRAFEPGNVISYSSDYKTVILEDLCLEMSSAGHGDIREPFLTVVHADGSRTSDFRYLSDSISEEKPEFSPLPGSYSENGKTEHLVVTLQDASYSLTLELHYYVYPECDCICRSAKLINSSSESVQLERMMSLQLDLPDSGWSVSSFHGAWGREMTKSDVTLSGGKFVNESRAGSSSSRANPFFMLHRPDTSETIGDCFGFNLIYSGNHYSAVEVNAFGKTRVVSGIQPDGFRFLLEPGACFDAPEAVMTYSSEGFTGQSQNMHRFVREHIVRGSWKCKPRPVLLNSWEACYFNISESTLVSMAKAGKELGIELLVMDDGWFGDRSDDTRALGDWDPNPKKLPQGLGGLCKKINDAGLQFGIWVEPEMVNVQSRLYEQHPDWVMAIPGKPHSEGRNQRILDLANPEVVDYIIGKMTEVFSSAPITYVKWDYNRIFSDVYSPSLPPERQGETAHRYILGLYTIMKALTERFPDILFEGCASGGNRFDLGILSYFPQIWASDNTDALSRVRIQEGYSYGYPMSTVSSHVSACPNHQTMRDTPLETRFNVAAFGVLGYELDLRDLTSEDKKKIKEQISLYKQWRELLQQGDFYRGRSGNIHEWTCTAPDGSHAVGLLMQELVQPNTQSERFFARGLKRDATYLFYNYEQRINVKRFGSLINTMTPIHIRTDSLVHNVIARVVKMPGESEELLIPGDTLMDAGVKLKQAFSGTGYNENVRFFQDFASRLYFMEEK
ncbi:MAG: alpha-galactosidase [Oscillospiraceae bacterium]|nr:alpha-galactosidase [Oscillospiraceae bacterium]